MGCLFPSLFMRHSAAVIVSAPEGDVISLAAAKLHLRVDHPDEDSDIELKLAAAINAAQNATGRKFITQTWNIFWDRWPCHSGDSLEVPFGQLQMINSLAYRDTAGTWVPLTANTDFIVDSVKEPGRIFPAYGRSWPSGQLYPSSSIRAEIVCGYGDESDAVPEDIRSAILLTLSHLYSHREGVTVGNSTNIESKKLEQGFESLLSGYILWAF